MRILLVHYSRTGTTDRVSRFAAQQLARLGYRVVSHRIQPRLDLPYPLWLALSFLPGARVPLTGPAPAVHGFDALVLASPKWTAACPPVNGFLASVGFPLPPTAVLLTCGGWDEQRYLHALQERLRRRGGRTLGGLAVRRRTVDRGTFRPLVRTFLDQVSSRLGDAPGTRGLGGGENSS